MVKVNLKKTIKNIRAGKTKPRKYPKKKKKVSKPTKK